MARDLRLSSLKLYPVKALRGIALEMSEVTATGLLYDRRWMVIDGRGRCLTQIEEPRMALIDVELGRDALTFHAPAMKPIAVSLNSGVEKKEIAVKLFRRDRTGIDVDDRANEWLSRFLKTDCRLVIHSSGAQSSYANSHPFHLVGEASWRDLNDRMNADVPIDRFRANFTISGTEPYEEDHWAAIRIGAVWFRVDISCVRCAVTTVDSTRGVRGVEPLRTLASYRTIYRRLQRQVAFGQYLVLDGAPGTVAVGDRVEIG
jgi:uncharacterized protein YcbX